jgi:bifunctional non-homologous end joining protein LigD
MSSKPKSTKRAVRRRNAVDPHAEKPGPADKPTGNPARKRRPSAGQRSVSAAAEPKGAFSAEDFLRLSSPKGKVTLEVPGGAVQVSHLDKVLWPEEHYTKADLLRYYVEIGPVMVKYLRDRPAILERYPNGIAAKGFIQQNVEDAPAILSTVRLENQMGRSLNYAVYTSEASLIYLVNLGTIAQNIWHSRLSNLDRPDYAVLDLDPHGSPFSHVLKVALALNDVLTELGITGYPKTSGSTGIHIYVPFARRYDYQQVAHFAEQVAIATARKVPDIATVERRISARKPGEVYVDSQQNARGKSAAAVYSVRAKPKATVSAPVTWEEVSNAFELTDFTIHTIPERVRKKGDLWADMLGKTQSLPAKT